MLVLGARRYRQTMLLQQAINNEQLNISLKVDGDYGPRTREGVHRLQEMLYCERTGTMGTREWTYLLKEYDDLGLMDINGIRWGYDPINFGEGKPMQREKTIKDRVVLHHTVSGPNPWTVSDYFSRKGFATHFSIGGDGTIVQMGSLDWWSWHINMRGNYSRSVSHADEKAMAQRSIGIEICSWGALKEKGGVLYRSGDKPIDREKCIKYESEFRGYEWFEKYTSEQIYATKILLRRLIDLGFIKKEDRDYTNPKWLDVDLKIIEGKRGGITSHTNYAKPSNKSDIHPQPDMLKMLNEL